MTASSSPATVGILAGGLVSALTVGVTPYPAGVLAGGIVSVPVSTMSLEPVEVLAGGIVTTSIATSGSASSEVLAGGIVSVLTVGNTPHPVGVLAGGLVSIPAAVFNLVQVVSGTQNTSANFTITFGAATRAGNCLMVFWAASGLDSYTISAAGWSVTAISSPTGINQNSLYYYQNAPSMSSVSVTKSGGSSGAISWIALEVEGINHTSPVDKQAHQTGTSNPVATPTSGTLTQSAEFLLGLACVAQNGRVFSGPPAGWTIAAQQSSSGAAQGSSIVAWYATATSTASVSTSIADSSSGDAFGAGIITWK
jgi:hypothetical protein